MRHVLCPTTAVCSTTELRGEPDRAPGKRNIRFSRHTSALLTQAGLLLHEACEVLGFWLLVEGEEPQPVMYVV